MTNIIGEIVQTMKKLPSTIVKMLFHLNHCIISLSSESKPHWLAGD